MINEIRLIIADFLNVVIINNNLIFLNFWHLVHFCFGMIIMWIIFDKFKKAREKLSVLLMSLILWEVFEWAVIMGGFLLFRGETGLDILFDLIAGFLGGIIIYHYKTKKKKD